MAWPAWACARRSKTRVANCSRCIAWSGRPRSGAQGGYGRCMRVELLHKLHDERKYASLDALREGIAADVAEARAWLAAV